MKIEYSSNNSGGDWWLSDADWKALEAAGWAVEWYANQKAGGLCGPYEDGRWLGALASRASKDFTSPREAIREFEQITGQTASDAGCVCCGPPHSFSWEDTEDSYYVRGIAVLEYLNDDGN